MTPTTSPGWTSNETSRSAQNQPSLSASAQAPHAAEGRLREVDEHLAERSGETRARPELVPLRDAFHANRRSHECLREITGSQDSRGSRGSPFHENRGSRGSQAWCERGPGTAKLQIRSATRRSIRRKYERPSRQPVIGIRRPQDRRPGERKAKNRGAEPVDHADERIQIEEPPPLRWNQAERIDHRGTRTSRAAGGTGRRTGRRDRARRARQAPSPRRPRRTVNSSRPGSTARCHVTPMP